MGLKEDAKTLFQNLLGVEFAKVIDNLPDPQKYPEDFLEGCKFLLEKVIGEEAAEKNIQPLFERYIQKNKR